MPVKLNLTPQPPFADGPLGMKPRVIIMPSAARPHEPYSEVDGDIETEEDGYRAGAIRRARVLHRVKTRPKK